MSTNVNVKRAILALSSLNKARSIIKIGENRALAPDGAVGHCREELSNDEFDEMWGHVEKAIRFLVKVR